MGIKPYIILFIGVLSVSFAAVFIRLADAPPLVIAAYRLGIASVILIPFASMRFGKTLKKLSRSDILLVLLSGVFVALHFALWITSLSYTSIASSVVLVTSHPVFVAVISYFLWRERLNRLAVLGIIVALVGVVFINYSGFSLHPQALFGDLLALLAAFFMGAYLVIGRQLRARINIWHYLAVIYTCAAIILLLAAVVSGQSLVGYSSATYTMLILLALVPQLIGHSSLNVAVRMMPVILVSVAILGEPVLATALGYFILGEWATTGEIVGGLLTLAGIFIVMRNKPKKDALKL